MLTPIHILFDLCIYFLFGIKFQPHWYDLALLLSVNLIDLDHLFAKPIYMRGRNSFKTHYLHKRWKWLIGLAAIALLNRYTLFLGIGVLSHLALDYADAILSKPHGGVKA